MSERRIGPMGCPEITLRSVPSGETHYRVHLCTHQDWSGWAPTREAAIERALKQADDISCDCQVANEPWVSEAGRDALRYVK